MELNASNSIDDVAPETTDLIDDEPPDGGTLAWLHALAGHLVVFNAQ